MATFERTIEEACREKVLPGAVMVAANTTGSFRYEKAIGSLSLDGEKSKSCPLDAVFWIASCTKLMTSIAILQCVERGQIQLDDDITKIVPDIANLEVLDGFEEAGKPIVSKRQGTITLRRALTHSSGIGYTMFDERIQKYRTYHGKSALGDSATVATKWESPMIFQPGTQWMYGANIDWVGQIVEKLNGVDLEEYMQKNIWSAVGANDITFWLEKRPDMKDRLMGMTNRAETQGPVEAWKGPALNSGQEDCFGGHGLYATIPDYFKVLHSLLANDGKLLRKETVDLMAQPHLEKEAKASFDSIRKNRPSMFDALIGEFSQDIDVNFGLGSLVFMEDDPGWRGKGTLHWGGLPNLFWFVDWQNDLCGMFGTQVMPPGDRQIAKLITMFEKATHEMIAAA